MGKADVAVNQMMQRKGIFADFVNGIVYGGRQVLNPAMLETLPGQSGLLYETEEGKIKALERRGDVRMKADVGTYSVIFAEESQRAVDYAMPVRNMLYDALEYVKQVQALEKKHKESGEKLKRDAFLSGIAKEDRLMPVVTIVFYFGAEWSGEKSLYEMMALPENEEELRTIKEYLPNYKINLVCAEDIKNTNVFNSCLQQIFDLLKYRRDKRKLYQYAAENREALKRMDGVEMTAAMTLLGEQKRLVRMLQEKGEEEFTMCEAIDELIEDGRVEGRVMGKAEDIVDLLKVKGKVPEDLQRRILSQRDMAILRQWLFLTVKVSSIAEFEEGINGSRQ